LVLLATAGDACRKKEQESIPKGVARGGTKSQNQKWGCVRYEGYQNQLSAFKDKVLIRKILQRKRQICRIQLRLPNLGNTKSPKLGDATAAWQRFSKVLMGAREL